MLRTAAAVRPAFDQFDQKRLQEMLRVRKEDEIGRPPERVLTFDQNNYHKISRQKKFDDPETHDRNCHTNLITMTSEKQMISKQIL
jgi:hypothetical protein